MLLNTPEAPLLNLDKKISSIRKPNSEVKRRSSAVSFAD